MILLTFLTILYFLPAITAGSNGRRNTIAIFTCNLLLGWTVLGWCISLIWALINDKPERVTQ